MASGKSHRAYPYMPYFMPTDTSGRVFQVLTEVIVTILAQPSLAIKNCRDPCDIARISGSVAMRNCDTTGSFRRCPPIASVLTIRPFSLSRTLSRRRNARRLPTSLYHIPRICQAKNPQKVRFLEKSLSCQPLPISPSVNLNHSRQISGLILQQ